LLCFIQSSQSRRWYKIRYSMGRTFTATEQLHILVFLLTYTKSALILLNFWFRFFFNWAGFFSIQIDLHGDKSFKFYYR
jgi:hypothetical protein